MGAGLRIRDLTRVGLKLPSLDIGSGEIVAVMGESGSGKSILLRAIADLDPNEGAVSLGDVQRNEVAAPEWRRLVGYLPADPAWWDERVGPHFRDWARARETVEALGLPGNSDEWPVSRLSTGERQRLGLARLLENQPQALLLDEPTSGLDPKATESLEKLITSYVTSERCCLWVTHDRGQAERIAHRRLLVEDGAVREVEP